MTKLNLLETYLEKNNSTYGSFIIEPLNIGHGITLGNTLRRILLTDLSSFSITGLRINNIKHEFSVINGLREDILEIILNLKEIIFKTSFFNIKNKNFKLKGFINTKGPKVITAGMFNLPKNIIKILNPNQYIGTLVNNSNFFLEVDIENNSGYILTEDLKKKNINENFNLFEQRTFFVDTNFNPIQKVNYKIKLIYDNKGNIKESLILEILTNGSITPKRSLQEAIKIILNLFYSLFINSNFINLSSLYNKNFN